MKKRIKVHGALIFISALLIIIFPPVFLRLEKTNYDLINLLVGLALLAAGFYLRICARGYKSEHSDNSKRLVTAGPYSLTRNPMYLGILLIALGVILLGFKWWVLNAFLVFFIACYARLMLEEEKKLTKHFGQDYLNYKKRTPLFFLKLSSLFKKTNFKHLTIKPAWIKKEIGAILPLFLLALGFNLWKILK